jgi:hypothetical protein
LQAGASPGVHATRRRSDRLFYTGMSLAIVVTVFIGFAPTYYLKGHFRDVPLPPLVHLHGLVFTSWIVLFVTQTVLIAAHRTDLHRRLGVAGAVIGALVVILGPTTAIVAGRRNLAAGDVGALTFLAIPLADMAVFLALVSAGLLYRRRPDAHKRLMLLATIGVIDAAIARWPLAMMQTNPNAFFEVTDLFIAAVVLFDIVSRKRVHPATACGGLLIICSQPLRLAIAQTHVWAAFAGALLR